MPIHHTQSHNSTVILTMGNVSGMSPLASRTVGILLSTRYQITLMLILVPADNLGVGHGGRERNARSTRDTQHGVSLHHSIPIGGMFYPWQRHDTTRTHTWTARAPVLTTERIVIVR